jgi:RsiW-degrading membrane proteinase PrsW (M82 family)
MGLSLSLCFGILPMLGFAWLVFWLDRYEKEPAALLGGVFLWGAIVAAGAAYLINTTIGIGIFLVTNSETVTDLATGSLVAPVIEESLKALAVLTVFLAARHEFDSLLDGLVYAGITALGFAAAENAYYIYQYGYIKDGYQGLAMLIVVRVLMVGWQHPFYTAFTGLGLAAARTSRRLPVKIIAPLAGLGVAILIHAMHNTLSLLLSGAGGMFAVGIFDWSGWLFMAGVIVYAIWRDQRCIVEQLKEEAAGGLITPVQYQTASSSLARSGAMYQALFGGRWLLTRRFYQVCAELAHKKQQRAAHGEESGNTAHIEALRAELAQLAQKIG